MEDAKITGCVQVFNLPGRRWHRRPAAHRQREGQRQARHADGPRRRRRRLHAEVEGHPQRHHPDRQADRGGRRDRRAEGLAVQGHQPSSSPPGRPTPRSSPSAAARPPAAPTTCCRCSWPRPSASTRKQVSYVSYDGGGELLPALLGNKIAFGASGFGEFLDQVEAGDVRVLAVTSEKPIDALKDVPTLKDAGHRPGLHQLARHRGPSRHLRRRQEGLDRRADQDARLRRPGRPSEASGAGPTRSPPVTSSAPSSRSRTPRWPTSSSSSAWHEPAAPTETGGGPARPTPTGRRPSADRSRRTLASAGTGDRAQYGLRAAWPCSAPTSCSTPAGSVGGASSNDPVGPRPVPILLGVLLIVVAVFYAVDVARGGLGEAGGGRGRRPVHQCRLAHHRPAHRRVRGQRPAHRAARLGHQRGPALLGLGVRARQPPPRPGPGRSASRCRSSPSTPSPSGSASTCPPASCKESSDGQPHQPHRRFRRRPVADEPAHRAPRRHRRHRRRRAARASARP